MRVQTTRRLLMSIDETWSRLCRSRMHQPARCPVFYLGVPKPVECRLPDGEGRVGATRECVSDKGSIRQEILVWNAPDELSFRLVETDLIVRHFVAVIEENFRLRALRNGRTEVTRTTTVEMRGGVRRLASPFVRVALMSVHRYVFKNWASTQRGKWRTVCRTAV